MPKQFVLVTQGDYDIADSALIGMAGIGGIFFDVAADLLHAFRTGQTPPEAIYQGNVPLNSTDLTHPVGAQWNFSNTASVLHFIFPQSFDPDSVSASVAESSAVTNALRNTLTNHTVEVMAYFNQNPLAVSHTFTWSIPASRDTGIHFDTGLNPDLHFAFGHVTFSGQMLVTVQRTGLQATSIEYTCSFTDLYDFNYNTGWPAPTAARVQTGFPTLGSSGNVFFTTVHFGRQDNNFNFQFQ